PLTGLFRPPAETAAEPRCERTRGGLHVIASPFRPCGACGCRPRPVGAVRRPLRRPVRRRPACLVAGARRLHRLGLGPADGTSSRLARRQGLGPVPRVAQAAAQATGPRPPRRPVRQPAPAVLTRRPAAYTVPADRNGGTCPKCACFPVETPPRR